MATSCQTLLLYFVFVAWYTTKRAVEHSPDMMSNAARVGYRAFGIGLLYGDTTVSACPPITVESKEKKNMVLQCCSCH